MSEKAMSHSEAVEIIKQWAEDLEVDTETDEFKDVIKVLKIPVSKRNLDYDAETRTFKYVLFYPIEKKDGERIQLVTIESTSMEKKRVVQSYKDSQKIDQAIAMIAESCDLEIGFASRIKDKDITRINAVIMGFFV